MEVEDSFFSFEESGGREAAFDEDRSWEGGTRTILENIAVLRAHS